MTEVAEDDRKEAGLKESSANAVYHLLQSDGAHLLPLLTCTITSMYCTYPCTSTPTTSPVIQPCTAPYLHPVPPQPCTSPYPHPVPLQPCTAPYPRPVPHAIEAP